ncbi:hypothetical protein MKW92_030748 [Papaver armeniacum]|nr:hypothetical protein MKW92_030748 [Papaver armeniacum]
MQIFKISSSLIFKIYRNRSFHSDSSVIFNNKNLILKILVTNDGININFNYTKCINSITIYAAMLTPQGRFLNLVQTSNPTDDPFDLLADVEATAMDELMDCFHKFQLRSNVDIENVSENFLSSDLKEEPEASALGWGAGVDKAGQSSAEGNSSGWKWYKDPRLDSLGFRGIFPSNTMVSFTTPLVEANKEIDELNYLQWRVDKGVAEEIPKEVVQKVALGSEVVGTSSDKKVGTVTTIQLHLGLPFKGSGFSSIKGQDDVKIKVIRPDWWPSEWFPDH